MNEISPGRIEKAVSCIAAEIGDRLLKTPKPRVDERDLWAEMTCCVLSSQVPYDLARAAAQRINDAGVLCLVGPPHRDILRTRLLDLLSTPLHFNDGCRRYRFPNSRADQIASGFCAVYDEFGSLGELLSRHCDARHARAWMVTCISGVGPKQASMFLRNAGASYDLAVIDRHVLRYMHVIKLCKTSDVDVATISKYERCEMRLRYYAESVGYPVGLLDWAIWIVMRAASRIEQQ
jgi:N-glycosylase/DNA lyase